MKWTFSTELMNKDEKVTIYFFLTTKTDEPYVQAFPYPKGSFPPFTMRYDNQTHEFKIMESDMPAAIKEYELIFSEAILNLKDLPAIKLKETLTLN